MRTPVKLATYGAGLAVAFTAALGVGSVVGSPPPTNDTHAVQTPAVDPPATPTHGTDQGTDHPAGEDKSGH